MATSASATGSASVGATGAGAGAAAGAAGGLEPEPPPPPPPITIASAPPADPIRRPANTATAIQTATGMPVFFLLPVPGVAVGAAVGAVGAAVVGLVVVGAEDCGLTAEVGAGVGTDVGDSTQMLLAHANEEQSLPSVQARPTLQRRQSPPPQSTSVSPASIILFVHDGSVGRGVVGAGIGTDDGAGSGTDDGAGSGADDGAGSGTDDGA